MAKRKVREVESEKEGVVEFRSPHPGLFQVFEHGHSTPLPNGEMKIIPTVGAQFVRGVWRSDDRETIAQYLSRHPDADPEKVPGVLTALMRAKIAQKPRDKEVEDLSKLEAQAIKDADLYLTAKPELRVAMVKASEKGKAKARVPQVVEK